MKTKTIKHLSLMFPVTSRWCKRCKKHRYHRIYEEKDVDATIITVYEHIKCLRCGKENEMSSYTIKRK